ncbi:hypothetical protein [Cryptosporangium aurantiacum]|uniref:Uncharacterized protein n=1 Tax=Cryptosporangium aurantiacum TaxID=134849 RepID=A0A1M7JJ64_9ACTN|nr:hypothetical protein [Cryptosporangium aurantiacum]SHM52975.1 hypothetical protein SAMN05443668_101815 [Cryptosporangium aurantiacum]
MSEQRLEPDPIGRLHRNPGQLLLLVAARPSVWLLGLGLTVLGNAVFLLVFPPWVWGLGGAFYFGAVVAPFCVWRMRVLDRRAVAEGRLGVPDPRRLPIDVREPTPEALVATADATLRRLRRIVAWSRGIALAMTVGFLAALPLDPGDQMPRPIFVVTCLVGAAWLGWYGQYRVPRFAAAARAAHARVVAGSAPRHVVRVVEVEANEPVVEPEGGGGRLRIRFAVVGIPWLRVDDELVVVGEWTVGAAVLATGPGRRGPRSAWGDLRPPPSV